MMLKTVELRNANFMIILPGSEKISDVVQYNFKLKRQQKNVCIKNVKL